MGTGEEKLTCCHPDAVSPEKVADARSWPAAVQRLPRWVPVFAVDL